ncbi:MAG: ATP-binding protein [Vicinamibacteria bacterium]
MNGESPRERVLVAWSSGKDSAWSLHLLRQQPEIEVVGLLTTLDESRERVAMHAVRRELLLAQAAAAGLPLEIVRIPNPCPNEAYEQRMGAAMARAKAAGVASVAFGDLYLEDVRRYRERQMRNSGLSLRFPLWGRPTRALAEEMIDGGLRATLTAVDPRRLDARFAGRAFDRALLAELPAEVDACGENGEFHSFAWAGPMFARPIRVRPGAVVTRDGFVYADLLPEGDAA